MSDDKQNNSSFEQNASIGASDFSQQVIAPAAFTPADGKADKQKRQLKPLSILLGSVLLVGLVIVWFLFTAKSVVIKTIPATNTFSIEGGIKFEIDNQYVMRQGNYRLKATHPGYYPLDVTIDVNDEQNQVKEFELKKLPGSLTVNTPNSVVSNVYIDDLVVGESGVKLENISAGMHQIKIEAPRYFPFIDTLEINGMAQHQTYQAKLKPAWADVNIVTEPSGAQIHSNIEGDGVSVGNTPFIGTLLEGKHLLTLKLPGYKSVEQPINITAGEIVELAPIYLEKLDGQLELSTTPSKVSVTLNSQYQGLTPLTIYLSAGQAQQLTLFKDGYQQKNQTINVPSGKIESLKLALEPQLGQVTVNASVPGALLYIDGRLMGRANQSVTLTAKQHDIVVKKEGYVDYQTSVLPRGDLQQIIDAQLKTLEQAKWENIAKVIETPVGATLKLFRPEGVFTMGASRREQGRRANEVARRIKLERPFYLGTHEITNSQYRKYSREHSSGHIKGNSLNSNNYPVVSVSWKQAALFCNWLSEQEKLPLFYQIKEGEIVGTNPQNNGYRLPTEAEWTWAARFENGQMLKYTWGKNLPPAENSGNFADRTSAPILGFIQAKYNDTFIATSPIASFPANPKGLFDLSGNAAEWMNDFYEVKTGLSRKIERDPLGAEQGDYHVIRGSSWAHGTMTELRLSFRDYGIEPRNDVGFRIARFVDALDANEVDSQTTANSGASNSQGAK